MIFWLGRKIEIIFKKITGVFSFTGIFIRIMLPLTTAKKSPECLNFFGCSNLSFVYLLAFVFRSLDLEARASDKKRKIKIKKCFLYMLEVCIKGAGNKKTVIMRTGNENIVAMWANEWLWMLELFSSLSLIFRQLSS